MEITNIVKENHGKIIGKISKPTSTTSTSLTIFKNLSDLTLSILDCIVILFRSKHKEEILQTSIWQRMNLETFLNI